MPFDLSEIADDPDLGQNDSVIIIRTPVAFVAGGIKPVPEQVVANGIITVASDRSDEMLPVGDHISGAIYFITTTRLYTTTVDSTAGPQGLVSDKIQWRGHIYRVQSVSPWGDFGYWQAQLLRVEGA